MISAERARSLHAPAWRAESARQKIQRYLEAIDLPGQPGTDEIYHRLLSKFPEELAKFEEAVADREAGRPRPDVYQIKNSSLEFSLLTGGAFRGLLHQAVMRWIVEQSWSPSRVLDIGCDNGILTCFYALLWPSACVIGVDSCSAGIERARELARVLGLSNARFEVTSIAELRTVAAADMHDLVLTTTVLHEAGLFAGMAPANGFLDEALSSSCPATPFGAFTEISQLLAPNGIWLGAEVITTPHLCWRWVKMLEANGLSIVPRSSARLKFGEELLSVIAASRAPGERATKKWVAGFWCRTTVSEYAPGMRMPMKLSGLAAQVFFESIPGKRMVAVARRWSSDASVDARECERIELWSTDDVVVIFRINHALSLEMYVLGAHEMDNARTNWESVATEFQTSGCRFDRRIDL